MTAPTRMAGDSTPRLPVITLQFSLSALFWLTFSVALALGVLEWIEIIPRAGLLAVIGWTVALNRSSS